MVAASEIQKELARIWESVEGSNKMRASLFNLIFYTQKRNRDAYVHQVAQKVIEKFPCRIIFITSDQESQDNTLKADVSLIYAGKGQTAIACDMIELEVSGDQLKRVPFVVLPHILPDLPIYLVWEKDPCAENPIFEQMQRYASRLIFDSESTDNLPSFADKLLKFYQKLRLDVADLNWARMENWRYLLTTYFYSLENLAHLEKVSQVQICYNSHQTDSFCHTRIQAVYLQAWLGCQLQWKFVQTKREGVHLFFVYKKQDKEIVVQLVPQEYANLAPGTVISIDLVTPHGYEFTFKRHPEAPNHIVTKITSPEQCELPTHHIFAKGESGQSLVKEICHRGMSDHFLKVLQFVSKMESVC